MCKSFRSSLREHYLREDTNAQGCHWNGTGRVLEPCEAKADGGKLRLKQVCGTGEEHWGGDRDSVCQKVMQNVTEVALLQLVQAIRLQALQSHSVNVSNLKSTNYTSCLGIGPSARLAYADNTLARSVVLSRTSRPAESPGCAHSCWNCPSEVSPGPLLANSMFSH